MRRAAPQHPPTVEKGYETRDIALDAILRWIVILFIFAGISSGISWVMFQVLAPNTPTTGQSPFSQRRPPEPRIQPSPRADLNKFRTEENQVLTSYYWVDKNAGIVSIPINQAIQLSAEGRQPVPAPNVPAGAAVPPTSPETPVPTSVPPSTQAGAQSNPPPGVPVGSTPPGQTEGTPTASPQPDQAGTATGGRIGGTQATPAPTTPQTTAPPTVPPRQPGAVAPTGTKSGPPPTGAAPTGANRAAPTAPPNSSR